MERPSPSPTSLRIVLCALAFACACSTPKPRPVAPLPEPGIVERLPEGATLALERPTPGTARLSLWVRAGSRHADPPALATVSAFWAEQASGARARVLPDGTELTLACDTQTETIARCAGRLARVFTARAPTDDQTRALRERLRAARLRARGDEARALEQASLGALLGERARALDPLGSDADDARITPSAIAGFFAAHYASDRSVLMAAGDVRSDELAKAFSAARKAATGRASTPPTLSTHGGVTVVEAQTAGIALSVAAPSLAAANELASHVRTLYPKAAIHAVPLAGLPLLIVRVTATDQPARRMERLVSDVARLATELDGSRPGLRPDESLTGLLRELGEGWSARGPQVPQRAPWQMGLALAYLEAAAPDAPEAVQRKKQRTDEATRALARGLELARGEVEGATGSDAADVTTAAGSRIVVQRRPGDRWFAAAIRLASGAGLDPVTRHGRAALLATALAEGCGAPWGFRLETTLAALDARVAPLVSPEGLGLSVTAPRENARAALDLVLRCALSPDLTQHTVERARVRLLDQLARDDALRFAAQAAHVVAPLAPGAAAPWGTPFGVSEVSLGELRRLHAQTLRGPGVTVWAAAADDAGDLARFLSRRLSSLARTGEPPLPPELGPVRALGGELTDVESLRTIIGLRAPLEAPAPLAAGVFADALRGALANRLGRALWSDGSGSARGAFAGVALALREGELPGLEHALRASLDELRARPESVWRSALAARYGADLDAHSSSLGWAQAAFRDALPQTRFDDELRALRALAGAAPGLWIMRPRP